MAKVVVAGGLGDLGRLITHALLESGKHEVYIMSRKGDGSQLGTARVSPLTGKEYYPFIQTDYSSEEALAAQLGDRSISTVICTFIMDNDAVSDAQLRLIRAAERSQCVKRFMPSEFNVEYDVSDEVLPYLEKRFHVIARKELEKTTSLEYTYIYPGMFMDYWGLPRIKSTLRPLCFFVDPASGVAVLPGDGEARMSMTFTTDAARYLVLALDLPKWPRIMTTATSTVSLNDLVALFEKNLGHKLDVQYQAVEKMLNHDVIDLPTNVDIARDYPERFPGGMKQLRGLIADLEAGIAMGAYDFGTLGEHLDLVETFQGKTTEPTRIEDLVAEAWKENAD